MSVAAVRVVAICAFAAGVAGAWKVVNRPPSSVDTVDFTAQNTGHFATVEQEAAGLCPWRNQKEVMQHYFPAADAATENLVVVSSHRPAVERRLGRKPTGDENSLRTYSITAIGHPSGTVITRRVDGEFGVIEIVIAVDDHCQIAGLELQRLREPEPSRSALLSHQWLDLFKGKRADSDWSVVCGSSALPEAARKSARAIADATRTSLVLLEEGTAHSHPEGAVAHSG